VGGLFEDEYRRAEKAKIDCGREHFKAIGNDVEFMVTKNYTIRTK
jgi:type III restriction enzyme